VENPPADQPTVAPPVCDLYIVRGSRACVEQEARPARAARPKAFHVLGRVPVAGGFAVNGLSELLQGIYRGSPDRPPDFERAVTVILATFAVFTGFTITGYLQSVPIGNLQDWRWWAFFALASLLLRYIFGSAIHLNCTYVGKQKIVSGVYPERIDRDPPQSISVFLLFKDLLFLVIFGMIAIYVRQAAEASSGSQLPLHSVGEFVRRSMLFVGAGFAWSVSDYFIRRIWARFFTLPQDQRFLFVWRDVIFMVVFAVLAYWASWAPDMDAFLFWSIPIIGVGFVLILFDWKDRDHPINSAPEWPGPFWRVWAVLDGLQFILAWVIISVLHFASDVSCAQALAALFLFFLFLDLLVMIRAVQMRWK